MKYWEPILVLGPGRCGSSAVARVLHERMHVHMGDEFRRPDETNPRGFYEDLQFRDLNIAHLQGQITASQWRAGFGELLIRRRGARREWGLKEPRIAHVCELMRPFLTFARIVRLRRRAEDMTDSMRRCYGWTLDHARSVARERERSLDQLPPAAVVLDTTQQLDDEEIESALQVVVHG